MASTGGGARTKSKRSRHPREIFEVGFTPGIPLGLTYRYSSNATLDISREEGNHVGSPVVVVSVGSGQAVLNGISPGDKLLAVNGRFLTPMRAGDHSISVEEIMDLEEKWFNTPPDPDAAEIFYKFSHAKDAAAASIVVPPSTKGFVAPSENLSVQAGTGAANVFDKVAAGTVTAAAELPVRTILALPSFANQSVAESKTSAFSGAAPASIVKVRGTFARPASPQPDSPGMLEAEGPTSARVMSKVASSAKLTRTGSANWNASVAGKQMHADFGVRWERVVQMPPGSKELVRSGKNLIPLLEVPPSLRLIPSDLKLWTGNAVDMDVVHRLATAARDIGPSLTADPLLDQLWEALCEAVPAAKVVLHMPYFKHTGAVTPPQSHSPATGQPAESLSSSPPPVPIAHIDLSVVGSNAHLNAYSLFAQRLWFEVGSPLVDLKSWAIAMKQLRKLYGPEAFYELIGSLLRLDDARYRDRYSITGEDDVHLPLELSDVAETDVAKSKEPGLRRVKSQVDHRVTPIRDVAKSSLSPPKPSPRSMFERMVLSVVPTRTLSTRYKDNPILHNKFRLLPSSEWLTSESATAQYNYFLKANTDAQAIYAMEGSPADKLSGRGSLTERTSEPPTRNLDASPTSLTKAECFIRDLEKQRLAAEEEASNALARLHASRASSDLKIEALQHTLVDLKTQLDVQSQRKVTLKVELAAARAALDHSEAQLKSALIDKDACVAQLAESARQLKQFSTSLSAAEHQVREERQMRDAAAAEAAAYSAQAAAATHTSAKLVASLEQLQTDVAEAHTRIQQLSSSRDHLERLLKEATTHETESRQTIAALEADLQDARTENDLLHDELTSSAELTRLHLAGLQARAEEAEMKIAEFEREEFRLNSTIQDAKHVNTELRARVAAMEAESVEQLRERDEAHNAELALLRQVHESAMDELLQRQRTESGGFQAAVDMQIGMLKSSLEIERAMGRERTATQLQQVEQLHRQVHDLKGSNSALKQALSKKLAAFQQAAAAAVAQLAAQHEEAIRRVQLEHEEAKMRMQAESDAKLLAAQTEHAAHSPVVNTLQNQLENASEKMAMELDRIRGAHEAELASFRQRLVESDERLHEAREQLAEAQAVHAEVLANLERKHDKAIAILTEAAELDRGRLLHDFQRELDFTLQNASATEARMQAQHAETTEALLGDLELARSSASRQSEEEQHRLLDVKRVFQQELADERDHSARTAAILQQQHEAALAAQNDAFILKLDDCTVAYNEQLASIKDSLQQQLSELRDRHRLKLAALQAEHKHNFDALSALLQEKTRVHEDLVSRYNEVDAQARLDASVAAVQSKSNERTLASLAKLRPQLRASKQQLNHLKMFAAEALQQIYVHFRKDLSARFSSILGAIHSQSIEQEKFSTETTIKCLARVQRDTAAAAGITVAHILAELAPLQQRLHDANTSIHTASIQIRTAISAYARDNEQLRMVAADMARANAAQRAALEAARDAALVELDARSEQFAAQLQTVKQSATSTMRKAQDEVRTSASVFKQRLHGVKQDVSDLRSSFSAACTEAFNVLPFLQAAHTRTLAATAADMQATTDAMLALRSSVTASSSNACSHLTVLQTHADLLEDKLQKLESQFTLLRSFVSASQSKVQRAESETQAVAAKQKADVSHAAQVIATLRSECSKTQGQLAASDAHLLEVQSELKRKSEELLRIQDSNDQLQSRIVLQRTELNVEISELKAQVQRISKDRESAVKLLEEQHTLALQAEREHGVAVLEGEKQRGSKKLLQVQQDHAAIMAKLESTNNSMQSAAQWRDSHLRHLSGVIAALKPKVRGLTAEINDFMAAHAADMEKLLTATRRAADETTTNSAPHRLPRMKEEVGLLKAEFGDFTKEFTQMTDQITQRLHDCRVASSMPPPTVTTPPTVDARSEPAASRSAQPPSAFPLSPAPRTPHDSVPVALPTPTPKHYVAAASFTSQSSELSSAVLEDSDMASPRLSKRSPALSQVNDNGSHKDAIVLSSSPDGVVYLVTCQKTQDGKMPFTLQLEATTKLPQAFCDVSSTPPDAAPGTSAVRTGDIVMAVNALLTADVPVEDIVKKMLGGKNDATLVLWRPSNGTVHLPTSELLAASSRIHAVTQRFVSADPASAGDPSPRETVQLYPSKMSLAGTLRRLSVAAASELPGRCTVKLVPITVNPKDVRDGMLRKHQSWPVMGAEPHELRDGYYLRVQAVVEDERFKVGDVILNVNGKSAIGMAASEFYDICADSEKATVDICRPSSSRYSVMSGSSPALSSAGFSSATRWADSPREAMEDFALSGRSRETDRLEDRGPIITLDVVLEERTAAGSLGFRVKHHHEGAMIIGFADESRARSGCQLHDLIIALNGVPLAQRSVAGQLKVIKGARIPITITLERDLRINTAAFVTPFADRNLRPLAASALAGLREIEVHLAVRGGSLGVELQSRADGAGLNIIEVTAKAAKEQGLHVGDVVMRVDDTLLASLPAADQMNTVEGRKDGVVVLTVATQIRADDEPLSVKFMRLVALQSRLHSLPDRGDYDIAFPSTSGAAEKRKLGLRLEDEGDVVKISAVTQGSLSHEFGAPLVGDVLVGINGRSVLGLDASLALKLLKLAPVPTSLRIYRSHLHTMGQGEPTHEEIDALVTVHGERAPRLDKRLQPGEIQVYLSAALVNSLIIDSTAVVHEQEVGAKVLANLTDSGIQGIVAADDIIVGCFRLDVSLVPTATLEHLFHGNMSGCLLRLRRHLRLSAGADIQEEPSPEKRSGRWDATSGFIEGISAPGCLNWYNLLYFLPQIDSPGGGDNGDCKEFPLAGVADLVSGLPRCPKAWGALLESRSDGVIADSLTILFCLICECCTAVTRKPAAFEALGERVLLVDVAAIKPSRLAPEPSKFLEKCEPLLSLIRDFTVIMQARSMQQGPGPASSQITFGQFMQFFVVFERVFGTVELCWLLSAYLPVWRLLGSTHDAPMLDSELGDQLNDCHRGAQHEWLPTAAEFKHAQRAMEDLGVDDSAPRTPPPALAGRFTDIATVKGTASDSVAALNDAEQFETTVWTSARNARWFLHWIGARRTIVDALIAARPLDRALFFEEVGLWAYSSQVLELGKAEISLYVRDAEARMPPEPKQEPAALRIYEI